MTQQSSISFNDIAQMSFEVALAELESITRLLERGDVELDNAVKYYERACLLQNYCQQKLSEAEMKVEKILHRDGVAQEVQTSELENSYRAANEYKKCEDNEGKSG